jgi:NAD(P)-dependent dehydrogenase (short-subunit alcohol dehydrogenase family)
MSLGPLLEGKVAIVTGGASGLGLATARLFASEGARVVVVDLPGSGGPAAVELIRGTGGDADTVAADVCDTPQIEAAVAFAEERYGRLDILVANAGILGRSSFVPVEEVDDASWQQVIDVNLTGTLRSFRAAVPALKRAGGGALSATSSLSGIFGTLHRLAYSASKGGIDALVRGLAVELAPDQIRVNAMAPGYMATNIRASLGRTPDEIHVQLPDPQTKARVRLARPDRDGAAEAARVHLFLCSELAAYVSGETIVVDGGFSIWNGT